MLPKKRRISRKEFPYILSHGKRFNSQHILLYVAPLSPSEPSRFAFSISKKISPHAVDRNTYRRRGYSIIHKHLATLAPGFLFFFSFKKGSRSLPFSTTETEVVSLLRLSGVIS